MELFWIDTVLMANYLQLRFASSVTTYDTIGKDSTGKALVIQGHFTEQLAELFLTECRIEREYMRSINKMPGKKN